MSTDTTDTTSTATDTTTTDVTGVVDMYLATWNETDAGRRAELIGAALGADVWYRDPMLEADGRDAYDAMIGAVQSQFPGLVMRRTSPVDTHRDLVRFNWALGAPDTDPMFAGLDVAKFDADGKLHRIIGFAGEAISDA
ncbi:MAG: nuclear transport factor 2 family protein [Acidimicrobiia bacterium]|nr:nuclear transport factor 2 family protein [Acidimicrobiia bacterium]